MLSFPVWKKVLIGVICLLGVLYASPNFLPAGTLSGLPSWMPGKQINLGLDLRGGAHLLMKVDTEKLIEQRLKTMRDGVRDALRTRTDRINYKGLSVRTSSRSVVFRVADENQASEARRRLLDSDPRLLLERDGASFTLTMSDQDWSTEVDQVIGQSIEVIRRRIDPEGTKEPLLQRQGADRILLQMPGEDDTERLKETIGKVAKMTFHLLDTRNSLSDAVGGRVPPGSLLLPSVEKQADGKTPIQQYLVEERVRVDGQHLTNAQPSFQDNQPVVSFTFDTVGGRKFGRVTQENVGGYLAVVLDNEVISAPRINGPILGGSGIITGGFSVQETQQLSLLLRAGALPADLTFLEERSVGPGMGQDAVDAGKLASIIGLVLVVLFMTMSYGKFGLMANTALAFNIALIIALLSGLQATLTLPGIAGIVLTIGMAVDANVLIFERIREEQANGRGAMSAIEAGYKRALTTIIDSNLTTLIAAVLLYSFGSGPIKGFAVTLSIGIITSMFTAIMVTRFFVVTWYMRKRPKALPI